jgi:hypothetical protein
MPQATFRTTETFPIPPTTLQQVRDEQQLRIKAGAITSKIDQSDPTRFVLTTTWNVIGENDPC